MEIDLAIIGAGVSGLTAAATAAGYGVNTLVIEHLAPGGQIVTVENIRNFPGHAGGIAGYELGPILVEQAEAAGAGFVFDTVSGIERREDGFAVHTLSTAVIARAVILATGSTRKTLDVPGEGEFEGKGLSHCAACDGHFFKEKTVVVAGGGDSAFDEADVLAGIVDKIVLVHRGSEPVARQEARNRIAAHGNVQILADTEISAIQGAEKVSSVVLKSSGGLTEMACDGVFAYPGLVPNTSLVAELVDLDEHGRIRADTMMQTSIAGLFVAGDLRAGSVRSLASAVGDGATAGASAAAFLGNAPRD